jgi:CO dehydrogenase maturation factor
MLGELLAASDDVTVMDMEASIEHMSRGTVRHMDVMLIVTEPYYRSLETTGRLVPLARDLGIPRVYAIANKVRDERDDAAVLDYCARHDVEVVARVPFDPAIVEADRTGLAIIDYDPGAPAVTEVRRLVSWLANGHPHG